MIIEYPIIFYGVIIGLSAFRMIIPLGSARIKDKLTSLDDKNLDRARNANIALASFTIVAIALTVTIDDNKITNENTFAFLSLAMFLFFIASYLFEIGYNKWVEHIGETLEYAGVISLASGLLYLIHGKIQSPFIELLYLGFLIAMIFTSIFEQVLNYRFHS